MTATDKASGEMRERDIDDAPAGYDRLAASAWAVGFNTALRAGRAEVATLHADLDAEQNLVRETLDELASRPRVPVNAVALRAELAEANQRIAYLEARVGYRASQLGDARREGTVLSDLLRGMARRASTMRRNYIEMCTERDKALADNPPPVEADWRDRDGDLWTELPDGRLSPIEYKGTPWAFNNPQDRAWVEAKYGPLLPASRKVGA